MSDKAVPYFPTVADSPYSKPGWRGAWYGDSWTASHADSDPEARSDKQRAAINGWKALKDVSPLKHYGVPCEADWAADERERSRERAECLYTDTL